ncbi:MAG: cytochrome c oxidase accessory protein CcoG [Phycisphaerales bacterium]
MSEEISNLAPEERVLSTLNDDGSRRWLNPRPSKGKFLSTRRMVAYLLIVIFSAVPWIEMNGKPIMLLDVMHREFTFFGKTFLPTDTLLLALLLIILFVTIFLVTALFGRIWCGWACPQTVYMEFLYRPIERLFMGTPGKRKPKNMLGLRKVMQYVVYLVISLHLAQTFLSYFVGADNLSGWIMGPPTHHPVAFIIVFVVTGLMMLDFAFFREQVCCVMCPYARMQSALLDKDSLIVTYDKNRGEPRGKKRKAPKGKDGETVSLPVLGDCIDCTMCVQTCPTGIDIRDGLQLECIGCAQCIDACHTIMEKIGRPTGLIRYSSERVIEGGKAHLIRPRIIVYPLILLAAVSAFIALLSTKPMADVLFVRGQGLPFNIVETDGTTEITNQVRLRISNRTEESVTYTAEVIDPPGVRIDDFAPVTIEPTETASENVLFVAPFSVFHDGEVVLTVRIADDSGDFETIEKYKILGPMSLPKKD